MQTILDSGGAIGIELAKALKNYTDKIKLVSRNPKKVNNTDILLTADLTNKEELFNAIKDSKIIYVTIGFPYNLKVWRANWMPFIKNTTAACIKYNCKLVFFDNMYMYDKNHLDGMNEETPLNPPSKKGKIRNDIANLILQKTKEGNLKALIARSADFYGSNIQNTSMLTETVFKPLSLKKKANWMSSVNYKHSFTYTPDAGKATALLGNTNDAFNQIWHLPTAPNPLTGKEWITTIAKELNVKPKYQIASKFIIKIMGLFIPIMREMPEMLYQYDRDYIFDSSKFEKHFDLKPTPYLQGIKEIIQNDYIK